MAFNQRAATPIDYSSSPLLPQADSSQAHDIPTGVSPTTAKLQDWVAHLRANLTPEFDATTISGLTFPSAAPSWFAVPNVDTTTHAGVVVGNKIVVDVALRLLVPSDTAGIDYNIRVVAIDDDAGTPTTSVLYSLKLEATGAAYSVWQDIHVVHTVAAAGTTRIRVEGNHEVAAAGNLSISSNGSNQRTARYRS